MIPISREIVVDSPYFAQISCRISPSLRSSPSGANGDASTLNEGNLGLRNGDSVDLNDIDYHSGRQEENDKNGENGESGGGDEAGSEGGDESGDESNDGVGGESGEIETREVFSLVFWKN